MPALPTPQFEVAVIKPSKPDERISHTFRGNQEDWRAITIKDHIRFAWDINYNDDESLAGAPKWLDDRFDILAKVATDDPGGATSQAPQELQLELQQMLRALLEDRFKMKYHWETRPITAYHLVAVSPRVTPADPKPGRDVTKAPDPTARIRGSQTQCLTAS